MTNVAEVYPLEVSPHDFLMQRADETKYRVVSGKNFGDGDSAKRTPEFFRPYITDIRKDFVFSPPLPGDDQGEAIGGGTQKLFAFGQCKHQSLWPVGWGELGNLSARNTTEVWSNGGGLPLTDINMLILG